MASVVIVVIVVIVIVIVIVVIVVIVAVAIVITAIVTIVVVTIVVVTVVIVAIVVITIVVVAIVITIVVVTIVVVAIVVVAIVVVAIVIVAIVVVAIVVGADRIVDLHLDVQAEHLLEGNGDVQHAVAQRASLREGLAVPEVDGHRHVVERAGKELEVETPVIDVAVADEDSGVALSGGHPHRDAARRGREGQGGSEGDEQGQKAEERAESGVCGSLHGVYLRSLGCLRWLSASLSGPAAEARRRPCHRSTRAVRFHKPLIRSREAGKEPT